MKFNTNLFLFLVNLLNAFVRDGKQKPGNKTYFANLGFSRDKQDFLPSILVLYFIF